MPEKSDLRILLACARPLVAEADQPIPLYATRPGEEMEAMRRGLEGISREIRVTVHGAAALPDVNRELMNPSRSSMFCTSWGTATTKRRHCSSRATPA